MDEHEQTETAPRLSFWKGNRKTFPCMVVVLAVCVVIIILQVNSLGVGKYDASARQAGINAKLAEEVFFNDGAVPPFPPGYAYPTAYSNNLSDLLSAQKQILSKRFDKALTDDPEVTFSFGTCNASGYTFMTTHKHGSKTFVFTD